MKRLLKLPALLVGIALAGTAIACGNTSTTKTEKVEGTEWNVTVKRVIQNIDGNGQYTVADTARVNKGLNALPQNPNITIGWTIPNADGKIWLVAYENEPVLNEKVKVTEANSIPSYGGDIQVAFKFADAKKWETITQENIGKRLAVFVNGKLMNAPQVNAEITSGSCSVSIPTDKIHEYLPDLDLEKLKQ
jgi:preprotein translocase subunit SecD